MLRGVDDQQEVRRREAVDEQIVDERALRRQQPGVLRLPDLQLRRRRCDEMRWTAASASLPAISISPMWLTSKRPARVADGHVLGDDARVLDRHVPAAKRHHLGARGAVASVEQARHPRRSEQFGNRHVRRAGEHHVEAQRVEPLHAVLQCAAFRREDLREALFRRGAVEPEIPRHRRPADVGLDEQHAPRRRGSVAGKRTGGSSSRTTASTRRPTSPRRRR